uniref:4-pyridoxolactonase n=1 Tax=Zeugodacus cucurbitae TaxID=28588 RepID=A0A0A1WT07_ZEUCU
MSDRNPSQLKRSVKAHCKANNIKKSRKEISAVVGLLLLKRSKPVMPLVTTAPPSMEASATSQAPTIVVPQQSVWNPVTMDSPMHTPIHSPMHSPGHSSTRIETPPRLPIMDTPKRMYTQRSKPESPVTPTTIKAQSKNRSSKDIGSDSIDDNEGINYETI